MSYDYGRKHISKHTGLTGVESKAIAKQLARQGLDYQSVDWETIGSDLYGHGRRTGGVKHHLKEMYGVTMDSNKQKIKQEIEQYSQNEINRIMPRLMKRHESRNKRSKAHDYSRQALNTFSPTDKTGVKKWMKRPNRYDIIGIDDII